MILPLIATFLIVLSVFLLVYFLAGRLSSRASQSPEATSTYACGENLPVSKVTVDPSLYEYAVYFLIFDSATLLLAFASQTLESSGHYVFSYLLVTLLSIILLPA